jgi:NADH-quinone oxidoreductase subunit H
MDPVSARVLVEGSVKIALFFGVLLTVIAYMTWVERRVSAWIQDRRGPNRVGPFGLLQPLADGIKFLFKEEITPPHVYRPVYILAPALIFIPALVTFSVIPIGPALTLFGLRNPFLIADVDNGILIMLAFASMGVYGVALAGWSSNNKYSLMGGLRSSAQLISYELALGIAIVGVLMATGSLRLTDMVTHQIENGWNVLYQFPGFLIFVTAAFAETNRLPFDLPEAETELVAGYHTEYSGIKFAMFYLGEYLNVVTVAAVATTLWLGGPRGPAPDFVPWLWPLLWFVFKVLVIVYLYIWIRATLPRIRYDRLMAFGWKILLPLALANVALTAVGVVALGG